MCKNNELNVEIKKAKGYAYRLLALKARTEYELKRKMKEKGFNTLTIKKVLENFKKLDLVNDSDYAQKLVFKRISQNRWGKRKIRQELINKGIADVVEKAINEVGTDEEYKACLLSAQKKFESLIKKTATRQIIGENESENILKKVILHLDRKGFSINVIKKIYEKFKNNHKWINGDKLDINEKKMYNESGRK